jgi:Ulp1 family protease
MRSIRTMVSEGRLAKEDVWHGHLSAASEHSRCLNEFVSMRLLVCYRNPSVEADFVIVKVSEHPMQNNGYDCGVWILACLAALFNGKMAVKLSETRLNLFRTYLAEWALKLPGELRSLDA